MINDVDFSADKVLVEMCLRHDPHAWEAMVRTHAKRIFNLCYRFSGKRDEAEDLMQEVFMRVYQHLKSFRPEAGCLQSWILRLGRNLLIDHYRHATRLRRAVQAEELEPGLEDFITPNPYRAAEQCENSRVLLDALVTLPPEIKEAIVLRDLQGMTYQEMSGQLRIPVGTVKSRVSRGHVKLAQVLWRQSARNSKPRPEWAIQPKQSFASC